MFSVIFEVRPNDGRKDEYLELAKHLKPILETIDGFVDNERFEGQLRPGWVLSHSTWRDEKSVVRWRTESEHHATQAKGRFKIFRDYHLRVGDVTSDPSVNWRDGAWIHHYRGARIPHAGLGRAAPPSVFTADVRGTFLWEYEPRPATPSSTSARARAPRRSSSPGSSARRDGSSRWRRTRARSTASRGSAG